METNEQIKSVLRNTLEDELEQFLEQMSELAEGDLEKLEEQAVKTSQAMGRGPQQPTAKASPTGTSRGQVRTSATTGGGTSQRGGDPAGESDRRPCVLSMLACRRPRGGQKPYARGSGLRRTVGGAREPDNMRGARTDQVV